MPITLCKQNSKLTICHRLACIKQLEQEMTCSVCLDICVRPCTTPCGKAFVNFIQQLSSNESQHYLLCVQQTAVKLICWLASKADMYLASACPIAKIQKAISLSKFAACSSCICCWPSNYHKLLLQVMTSAEGVLSKHFGTSADVQSVGQAYH